jgi:HEAT repeat protein
MDVEEFVELLTRGERPDAIDAFIDHFRERETSLVPLRRLLEHANEDVVEVGAWILSEVADVSRGRELFESAVHLLSHDAPTIRFRALQAVAHMLRPNDENAIFDVIRLLGDSEAEIRAQAAIELARVSEAVLMSVADRPSQPKIMLALQGAGTAELTASLQDSDPIVRAIAAVGIMRNFRRGEPSVEPVLRSCPSELKELINNWWDLASSRSSPSQ